MNRACSVYHAAHPHALDCFIQSTFCSSQQKCRGSRCFDSANMLTPIARKDFLSRLVVVSNRVALPRSGRPPQGGLAVGVMAALRDSGGLWFGWNGSTVTGESYEAPELREVGGVRFATVPLSGEDYRHYYKGFANRALWPLLHYRLDLFNFQHADYEGYRSVNTRFARKLGPLLNNDDVIWVHDYHLIPLGHELRKAGIDLPIGFFLHTPFPAFDVLRALPGHTDLLRHLCEYDLIGFQTRLDQHDFLQSARWGLGAGVIDECDVILDERRVRTGVFPIGIDVDEVAAQADRGRRSRMGRHLQQTLSAHDIIVGVDRIDYSKGLAERFYAFRQLLQNHPETHGRVVFMQIAQPSRSDVPEYRKIRRELDGIAGEIMGRYADYDWAPVQYMSRSFARATVLGLLAVSRVGLVTPLRDGMNLVAKEFVATQAADDPGVLILSRLAGAAQELTAALLVNPYDIDEVASSLARALNMPQRERRERWHALMQILRRQDVRTWCHGFIEALEATRCRGQIH